VKSQFLRSILPPAVKDESACIFYDRVLYIEFNECLFRSKKNDLISELFAGIPPNISKVFRY
jgi:hypothetical protein